jgi:hypothetical protein
MSFGTQRGQKNFDLTKGLLALRQLPLSFKCRNPRILILRKQKWNELFSSKYFEPSVFEILGAVFPGALSFAE